ncbi:MAG: hypothetical protein FWC39_10815 [Bacteroidetes bacterium]|nr:hypothetical protein [Bacteroidota bacterium]
MKRTLFTLVLFSLMTSAFIQTAEAHNPPPHDTIYLVIDKYLIPLDRVQMTDFNPKWIKSIEIHKKDILERGKVVIIPKKRFKKKLLKLYVQ